MRVSMGRLQGLRLGMSHQNDAAQKAAAASADLGWSEEGRLAQKPGSTRAGAGPPVCDLHECLSCSALNARVPTTLNGI